jgi:antitoxin FitA
VDDLSGDVIALIAVQAFDMIVRRRLAWRSTMGSLTIRNLDDRVKEKIRMRAAKHGRSMEEEARRLLDLAVSIPSGEEVGLGTAIRRRFAPLGGFKLEPLPRGPMCPPPKFK